MERIARRVEDRPLRASSQQAGFGVGEVVIGGQLLSIGSLRNMVGFASAYCESAHNLIQFACCESVIMILIGQLLREPEEKPTPCRRSGVFEQFVLTQIRKEHRFGNTRQSDTDF
jgi:hypothetical protein